MNDARLSKSFDNIILRWLLNPIKASVVWWNSYLLEASGDRARLIDATLMVMLAVRMASYGATLFGKCNQHD
jgi:hypothetical protein